MPDKNDKPADKAPRKPLSMVPTGKEYSELVDDKFRWQVAVENLGGLKRGAKVGAVHLQPGANIDQLVERGLLIPLSVEESAEAAVNEPPVVPPYPTADLQPPKPVMPPNQAHTLDEAKKADDARRAEEAKHADEAKAKAEADARAKADADAKAKQDAVDKAKAEMTGKADADKK